MCGRANAKVTGNALFSYYLTKENGEWLGEFEQSVNLRMHWDSGLGRLLGVNIGFVGHGKEWDLLGGLTPTYAINLQGKRYQFSSGYSVHKHRNTISSRLYENLRVSLPGLPTFRLAYAKQGTEDSQGSHRINLSASNMQFSLEDEIGPFRISLTRQAYTSRNLIRGPEYDVTSSNNSGNIDFGYSYRRLFSLNGRYKVSQLYTERTSTGETEGRTQDFSLGFRISPISTIALSGATIGRRQRREGSVAQGSPLVSSSDSSTNRLQLMLEPVGGVLVNAGYSRSDDSRVAGKLLSNETRSLMVNLEPRQDLTVSGHFMVYDSQEQGRKSSTLTRNSFDLRAEPLEGLGILSRLSLSRSTDFATGLHSDRNSVTTRLEALLTENFRADISHDWQKSRRRSVDVTDRETQHRLTFDGRYSFARVLDLNFKYSKSMSNQWKGGTTRSAWGLSYSMDESHVSLRYNRSSSPNRSPSLSGEQQWTTQTFTVDLNQEVGRDTNLSLSYEGRLGGRQFGRRGSKRILFNVNIRF